MTRQSGYIASAPELEYGCPAQWAMERRLSPDELEAVYGKHRPRPAIPSPTVWWRHRVDITAGRNAANRHHVQWARRQDLEAQARTTLDFTEAARGMAQEEADSAGQYEELMAHRPLPPDEYTECTGCGAAPEHWRPVG